MIGSDKSAADALDFASEAEMQREQARRHLLSSLGRAEGLASRWLKVVRAYLISCGATMFSSSVTAKKLLR